MKNKDKDYHPEYYDFPQDAQGVYRMSLFRTNVIKHFKERVDEEPESIVGGLRYWMKMDR